MGTAKRTVRFLLQKVGLEIRRLPSTKGFNSNRDVVALIDHHLGELAAYPTYCVDVGASDGVTMSNSYALYKSGWNGLSVEYDAAKVPSLSAAYMDFPSVNLAKCMVTPPNILPLLEAYQVPHAFGFLTLDIDGYDYFVLEQILTKYRPMLICAEINEKIPPPVKFTVKWHPTYVWQADHFYGQSISQLHMLCIKHNYALVELHYNNAFLVPNEHSRHPSLSPEEAFRLGYLDKADRKDKFPWNANVEDLLHMKPQEALAFINTFFEKYKGMFDASI